MRNARDRPVEDTRCLLDKVIDQQRKIAGPAAQRRKLKKALVQLRKLARQLGSKAAAHGIAADVRAALHADADALASEVQTLTAAPR